MSTPKPRAWLCELLAEDGTTRTQVVEQDPRGLRWNDQGDGSPYDVTPLYDQSTLDAAVAAERERCARVVEQWDVSHPLALAAAIRLG